MNTNPDTEQAPPAGTVPPALAANATTLLLRAIAKRDETIAELLATQLPAALARALMLALAQAPSEQPVCWMCFERKVRWDRAHADQLNYAYALACQAAGVTEDAPDAGKVTLDDAMRNLADELQPDPANPLGTGTDHMPMTFSSITHRDGTGLCALDGTAVVDQLLALEATHGTPPPATPGAGPKHAAAPSLLAVRPGVDLAAAAAAARQLAQ